MFCIIQIKEITKQNWFDVVLLSSSEDQKNKIFEKDIASNCLSLTQASMEDNWITRAIYHGETLVGFTMYGYSEELKGYEICRIMIDYRFQGNGYGKSSLLLIVEDMVNRFGCNEILLCFNPDNTSAQKLYESVGFRNTGIVIKGWHDEHIYSLTV
ncbi:GNAT family N-acetyltransferase [Brevibacillus ginsengisoli]|uniref:GNAT family N-acetyltransferase n=1 Tax=Brevibacillus ginsengisoli TaxID=363854 RepID=UPI003CEF3AD4